jgi:hypothetical protein
MMAFQYKKKEKKVKENKPEREGQIERQSKESREICVRQ